MPSRQTTELALAKLGESGLSAADAKALGLVFVDDIATLYGPNEAAPHRKGPGIQIHYYDTVGQPIESQPGWGPYWRVRKLESDEPSDEQAGFDKQTAKTKGGKPKKDEHKYDQPPRSGTTAYLPQGVFPDGLDWPTVATDIETSIVITEGEWKAACACKHGVPTIGLGGVWNYKSREMWTEWLPILAEIVWAKRQVYIVYDSDVKDNPSVAKAVNGLAEQLYLRGAIPYCIFLPRIDGQKKTGLDDYIVHYGIEPLKALCLDSVEHLMAVKALWEWNEHWYHVHEPHCLVNRHTGKITKKETYVDANQKKEYENRTVDANGNIQTELISITRKIFEWPMHAELDRLVYLPGQSPLARLEGESAFNTWPGWGCEPREGDVQPFMDLIDHLFGQDTKEAKWILAWFAYQLQYPGTKLATAVLLTGGHGIGKTMLGEVFRGIFGQNFSEVSSDNFFGQFNEWAARKQFILANEVVAKGDRDRRQHASALKDFVTRKKVTINEKYGLKYELDDYTNIFMTANPMDSLPIENGERRYFVYRSQAEKLELVPGFLERWDAWKGTGIAAVFWYMVHKVDVSWFKPFAAAPETESFKTMQEHSQTERDYAIKAIMADGIEVGDALLTSDLMTVAEIYAHFVDGKTFRGPSDLRTSLIENGAFKIHDPDSPNKGRIKVGQKWETYWALRNQDKWKKASIAEVKAYLKQPDRLVKQAKKY